MLASLPFLTTGASDGRFTEPLGVQVYGFGPMPLRTRRCPSDLAHAPRRAHLAG